MQIQPSNLKNTARISFEEGDQYDLKFGGVLAYVNPNGASVHGGIGNAVTPALW